MALENKLGYDTDGSGTAEQTGMSSQFAAELVRYAWNNYWRKKYGIPELFALKGENHIFGSDVFATLGVPLKDARALVEKCVEQYGILDEVKCEVFIKHHDKGSRKILAAAFFYGENTEKNLCTLIKYAWNKHWKEKIPIPELIAIEEVRTTLGTSVGTSLNDLNALLSKCFTDYRVLTCEKAAVIVDKLDKAPYFLREKIEACFFGLDNKDHDENTQRYLTAYQQKHQKRLSDFTENDYKSLPAEVKKLLCAETPSYIPPPSLSGPRRVRIRWTPMLEDKLSELVKSSTEPEQFIRQNSQLIWNTLGVSSFAALMKAQELKLIDQVVHFGDGQRDLTENFHLIEFDKYPFIEYALDTCKKIEQLTDIVVDAFSSPVHGQNIHVNVPIEYKGFELTKYTEKERAIIQTIATYLEKPNSFEKVPGTENTIYKYLTPENLTNTAYILATPIGETRVTHVYLPIKHSTQPGDVITGVLQHPQFAIWLLRHEGPGIIRETS